MIIHIPIHAKVAARSKAEEAPIIKNLLNVSGCSTSSQQYFFRHILWLCNHPPLPPAQRHNINIHSLSSFGSLFMLRYLKHSGKHEYSLRIINFVSRIRKSLEKKMYFMKNIYIPCTSNKYAKMYVIWCSLNCYQLTCSRTFSFPHPGRLVVLMLVLMWL